jgi:hypothetical protein
MAEFSRNLFAIAIHGTALALSFPAAAYETDQFYNRSQTIADSTTVLNRQVNQTLEDIVINWDKDDDQLAFVNAVYNKLGGHHWVDKLERWAMKSPEVDKLGIGSTLRVNEQLIGSDKIGHFFSQGRKFYRRYLKFDSEQEAAKHSAFTERAIFGSGTTGSYSNADLVANFEGYRFYRSLFDDDVIPGKPAILRWHNGGWIIQRDFDWADHVNEYWDEALNVNHYDKLIYKHIRERMVDLCQKYWEDPSLYAIEDEESLRTRYSHLELRDTSFLRLDIFCPLETSRENENLLAEKRNPESKDSALP